MVVNNTKIIPIQADVFEFSKNNVECGVFWLKTGFNPLFSDWSHQFVPQLQHRTKTVVNNGFNLNILHDQFTRIFTHDEYRLFKIQNPLEQLRFIYLFPNCADNWISNNELYVVEEMLSEALFTVSQQNITSIAINGIHGANGNGHDVEVDNDIMPLMVSSIANWLAYNATSLRRIFLVNKCGDGFIVPHQIIHNDARKQ